jgi:hypothetical protein
VCGKKLEEEEEEERTERGRLDLNRRYMELIDN